MKLALRWCLGLYILLLGSEELFSGPGLVYLIGVCLLLLFATGLVVRTVRIRFSFTGAVMVLFGVVATLSIFWSADIERTASYTFMLAQLLSTTWITTACIEDNAALELIIWWLLLSPLIPGTIMVHDFMTGNRSHMALAQSENYKELGSDRMTFAGADPNLVAFRCAIGIIAGVHLGLTTRNVLVKIMVFTIAGMILWASLETGSRGGALALVGGVVVYLLAGSARRKGAVLLTVLGFAALLLIAIPHMPPKVASRYLDMGNEIATGDMAGRKFIYKEGIQSINRNPTLGVGYIAYSSASQKRGGMGLAGHNDLFQVILELGLVGLGVFLILLGGLAWNALSAPASVRPLMLGLLTCYFISSSSINLLTAKLVWVLFGILLGAGGLKDRTANCRDTSIVWMPLKEAGPDE